MSDSNKTNYGISKILARVAQFAARKVAKFFVRLGLFLSKVPSLCNPLKMEVLKLGFIF